MTGRTLALGDKSIEVFTVDADLAGNGQHRELSCSNQSVRSVKEFAKELEDLDIDIRPPRTEQIALRLSKEDLQLLRSWRLARDGTCSNHVGENCSRRVARAFAGQE